MVDFQGTIILFLTWLAFIIFLRKFINHKKAKPRPPGPISLPIIGNLHLLAPIPHQALHKLSKRYGPLMHIFLGSVPCVVVSSPEIAKEVLKTHEVTFSDRPQIAVIEDLAKGSSDFAFARHTTYWKFMRKLCMNECLGGQMLDQFKPVRHEEIKWFLQTMLKKAKANDTVAVGRQLIRLTNNVTSRMTVSKRCSSGEDEANEIRKLVQEMTELTGRLNLSDYIWFCKNLDLQGFGKRVKEVRAKFDIIMERIIKEHKEAKMTRNKLSDGDNYRKDLLDILLDIAEDEKAEVKLSTKDITVFIQDLFNAGSETTSVTIEWALAELINNPDVMEKAREEIYSVVGKSRIVEESDIPNLPYLQAIVKESLRLHPTIPMMPREANKTCTVAGYEIPVGTRLFVNVWAISRDPNHWDNPLKFCPERFINSEGDGKSKLEMRGQHFQLLPFGSGRRMCPGTSLALQVIHPCLGSMIQCFDWKIAGGSSTVNMEEGAGLTLPLAHPLVCTPVARLNPLPPF